mgnify:CR=1 FL=1
MNSYQITGLILLAVYYTAYFIKMLGQKKKGIQTTQFGIGEKVKRTVIIEKTLQIVSFLSVIAEIVSLIRNTGGQISAELRLTGLGLAAFGTTIFIIAMLTMQDSWRAGIAQKDSTSLVTKGIYKVSRNPAFLGFDLIYIGICITFFNVILLFISLFGILMMHLQILEEEKFLPTVFGAEYEAYRKRVGRYL